MAHSDIAAIQESLGLTPAEIEALKQIRLVWQRLEALRKQADRDAAYRGKYHDLLLSSLTRIRMQQPLPDEQIIETCRRFWAWYADECESLGISGHGSLSKEVCRGCHHLAWCEKWLPTEYVKFTAALDRTIVLPSQHNFDRLKEVAAEMLRAYVGAIP